MTKIKEVDADTEVTFTCSMKIQGAKSKETFTLGMLGWSGEQGEDLKKQLQVWFEDWLYDEVDSGWYFKEDK